MAPYYAQGLYYVTGLDQAWTESSNGNDMLVLKVRVDGEAIFRSGPSGEPVYDLVRVANNYERTIRVTLTAESIEIAMKKLRYAGFAGTSFDDLNLVGAQFLAVSQEPHKKDGKVYEQWDLPLPPRTDSGPPLESKPGITRRLNALFGKQLKGDAPAAAALAAPKAAPPAADDDIPFAWVAIFPFVAYLLHGFTT